jgi:hypothetical protein
VDRGPEPGNGHEHVVQAGVRPARHRISNRWGLRGGRGVGRRSPSTQNTRGDRGAASRLSVAADRRPARLSVGQWQRRPRPRGAAGQRLQADDRAGRAGLAPLFRRVRDLHRSVRDRRRAAGCPRLGAPSRLGPKTGGETRNTNRELFGGDLAGSSNIWTGSRRSAPTRSQAARSAVPEGALA